MLKKRFLQVTLFALVLVGFTSCTEESSDFDGELLIAKWERPSPLGEDGYEYYRFDVGGIGATWDTSEDVTEAEAQEFKWTLIKSDLTLQHYIETTDQYGIPKVYTIVELTSTTLVYKDDFGNIYEYSKVIE